MAPQLRTCLSDPIREIFDAARYLDAAVSAHLSGNVAIAEQLIRLADMLAIRDWTESLWGPGGPFSRPLPVANAPPIVPKHERQKPRDPPLAMRAALVRRDGLHCRFCGIPLVRRETRKLMQQAYPHALRWGPSNPEQHFAFQAMDLTYDHVLPHARKGSTDIENLIVTCQPCNCGRAQLTLEQVGLFDPRLRNPIRSTWDGLERFKMT